MLTLLSAALILSQLLSVRAFDPLKQRPREIRRNPKRQLSYEAYIDAAFTNNSDVVLNIDTKDKGLRNYTAPYGKACAIYRGRINQFSDTSMALCSRILTIAGKILLGLTNTELTDRAQ